jgi:hypothetical protein
MSRDYHTESLEERVRNLDAIPKPAQTPEKVKVEAANPDKSYAKLSTRLPLSLKVDFERLCVVMERTPSLQTKLLIKQFVDSNRDKLDE